MPFRWRQTLLTTANPCPPLPSTALHCLLHSHSYLSPTATADELDVHVAPYSSARPVRNFSQLGLDHQLLTEIAAAGYERPTAIQAQTVPVVLSGRDVIALAKTGMQAL